MEKFGEMNMIRNPSSSRSFPWFLTHIDYVTKNTRKSFGPGWCSTIFNSENLKSFRPQKVLVHIVQRILMWCNFRRLCSEHKVEQQHLRYSILSVFCWPLKLSLLLINCRSFVGSFWTFLFSHSHTLKTDQIFNFYSRINGSFQLKITIIL